MKRIRLLVVAAMFSLVAGACSSDLVGPDPSAPNHTELHNRGEGGFGSGG